MPADEASYDNLRGVPLYYRRAGRAPFQASFRSTYAMEERLGAFVASLSPAHTGLGPLRRIDTAGAFVARPGAHGLGRAFDLDAILWKSGQSCVPYHQSHANPNLTARRRYLAVDAMARRYFKYVLDGYYNAAHRDHFHLDTTGGTLVFRKSSRSDVVFIQATCNAMMGGNVAVDGSYGARTDAAYRRLKRYAGVKRDTSSVVGAWHDLLLNVSYRAFRDQPYER